MPSCGDKSAAGLLWFTTVERDMRPRNGYVRFCKGATTATLVVYSTPCSAPLFQLDLLHFNFDRYADAVGRRDCDLGRSLLPTGHFAVLIHLRDLPYVLLLQVTVTLSPD